MTSNDIAETTMTDERSVMDDVFSKASDIGGESAPPDAPAPVEAPAPAAEATPEPAAPEAPAEAPAAEEASVQGRDPKTGRFVPVTELVSERKRLQEKVDAEARLRTEAEARATAYQAQIEQLQRQIGMGTQPQPQMQPAAQPARPQERERPDPWTDPEGALAWDREQLESSFESQLFETRVVMSRNFMRSQKPDFDAVEQAFVQAARSSPHLVDQLRRHPMPAQYAYEVGRQVMAMQEIGTDLEGYRKRIADEAVQAALANLKSTGTPTGAPTPQKFPTSLADQTATPAGTTVVPSEEDMMASVFSKRRA